MLKVSMHLHALLMQVSHLNIQSYFSALIKCLMKDTNSIFIFLFSSACLFSLQLGSLCKKLQKGIHCSSHQQDV